MKKALITGASGGIGLEIAKRLTAMNYQVTLVARNEEKLNEALKNLISNGNSFIVADLTKNEDLQKVAVHLAQNQYDVLINNAGAGLYGQFAGIPLEQQLNMMHLNMDALVTLSYSFLKNASPGSTLVNVGSLLAYSSLPGGAVYAGTKSFVANFSESLWYEFKNKGVFIMGFNPGATDSDFHSQAGRQTTDFPKFVISSVGDVVDELIKALRKRKYPRVIQGFKNRFMLFGFRFISRKTAVNIMGQISPGIAR